MNRINILWVDDEIDLLKPHIIFLEQRDYHVTTCDNGNDAIELVKENRFDIVFLDENMPGLNGLEVLELIKQVRPSTPVVMITKNEEERIMEEAIGSKISDYLIKPVNPNQILLSLKKLLDHSRLVSEKFTQNYQQAFQTLSSDIAMANTYKDWSKLYEKLVYWELQLEQLEDQAMFEVLETQKQEANAQFSKFIEKHYKNWFTDSETPVLSHQLLKQYVFPKLNSDSTTLLIVIDNLRLDQWKIIEPELLKQFSIEESTLYYSILPTATQYARNSLFSGLTPLGIQQKHPEFWKQDYEDGGKNDFEDELLTSHLKREHLDFNCNYSKVTNIDAADDYVKNITQLKQYQFNVLVYNFVDMLSHAKTDTKIIKELAATDKAYRSLTLSWFKNSPLLQTILQAKELGIKIQITTDHGTINVKHPSKVIGDKQTSSNLRYKTSKSLTYSKKEVYDVKEPQTIQLPNVSINSHYIFAKESSFFAYPNNYNHYVNYYKNTYQHGGISLEEMIIPFISLAPK